VPPRLRTGPFGDLILDLGSFDVANQAPEPIGDYVVKARKRIAELKNAPSPWDESTAVVIHAAASAQGNEIGIGPKPIVISPDAEAAAVAVFSQFTLWRPSSAVAIFPKEDGGLRLQSVGDERTVIVDISTTGTEFAAEYAGDDVYHTERIRNPVDAARFIVDSTR
jgi:hypothetical protein